LLCLLLFFFFFSSRRRHTRSYGDWSSDVCSSDLATAAAGTNTSVSPTNYSITNAACDACYPIAGFSWVMLYTSYSDAAKGKAVRSEERRVGKECRSRGAQEDEKKRVEEITDIDEH